MKCAYGSEPNGLRSVVTHCPAVSMKSSRLVNPVMVWRNRIGSAPAIAMAFATRSVMIRFMFSSWAHQDEEMKLPTFMREPDGENPSRSTREPDG